MKVYTLNSSIVFRHSTPRQNTPSPAARRTPAAARPSAPTRPRSPPPPAARTRPLPPFPLSHHRPCGAAAAAAAFGPRRRGRGCGVGVKVMVGVRRQALFCVCVSVSQCHRHQRRGREGNETPTKHNIQTPQKAGNPKRRTDGRETPPVGEKKRERTG